MGTLGRQSHLASHGDSRMDAQQTIHYKQHMFRSDLVAFKASQGLCGEKDRTSKGRRTELRQE